MCYSCRILIEINMATNKSIGPNEIWALKKGTNQNDCKILYLKLSWTHGLIAQSVRAYEQNSVIVSSNLTQAEFLELFLIIIQSWIAYVSDHSAKLMWLPLKNSIKAKVTYNKGNSEKWYLNTEQKKKLK